MIKQKSFTASSASGGLAGSSPHPYIQPRPSARTPPSYALAFRMDTAPINYTLMASPHLPILTLCPYPDPSRTSSQTRTELGTWVPTVGPRARSAEGRTRTPAQGSARTWTKRRTRRMNSGWRERRLFSLEGNTSFFSAPTPTRARSVTLLRGVLPTAISPAGVSIPTLTRAPTARRLADSHLSSRSLDPDAHQSSYCAASCQQPSHQPASRRSPEPLLRGVLPTAIPPAGVSTPALIRAR